MSKELGFKFLNDVFDFYLGEIDRLEKKNGEKIISKDSGISEDYHDLFIFSVINNKEVKNSMKVIRVTRIIIDFENENIDKSDSNYNIFFNKKRDNTFVINDERENEVDYSFFEEIKTITRQQEG